jgi:hypothetical protein
MQEFKMDKRSSKDNDRAREGERALKECANMINKSERLCLNWEICVYWRKTKKECRYFLESVLGGENARKR